MTANAKPLLEQLRADAERDAVERRTRAEDEAEALGRAAERRVAVRRAEALAAHARKAEQELNAARTVASQRVRRDTLAARAIALDRIFERAAAYIESLAGHPRFAEVLKVALADALTCLPEGPVTLRCAPPAAEAVRRATLGASGVTVREDPSVGLGAILESEDGAIAVDVTLARMLSRRRRELAISVLARMEGSPS